MCFSASASFIVGGSLIVLGSMTLRRVNKRTALAFAAIPLLFGIQQLIEGVLWLSFDYDIVLLQSLMAYIFTMFSHVFWPLYMPFAIGLMEPELWRRKVIWFFQFIGIVVGVHMLILIATHSLAAEVGEHMIYVVVGFYDWPMMLLYVVATCMAAFFSSHNMVRVFGILSLLLLLVTHWFYSVAIFSVWCFFAAILSFIIYLQFNRTKQ